MSPSLCTLVSCSTGMIVVRRFLRHRFVRFALAAGGLCCGLVQPANAQIVWANNGSNALDNPLNWLLGSLPTGQVASFTSATFTPNTLQLQSGNLSVAGISLGAGAGALTFSSPGTGGAKTLSIGSSGVVNSSSNTLTFDVTSKVNITLSANATFVANGRIEIDDDSSNNSTSGFTIGAFTLTLDGTNTSSLIEKGFVGTGGSIIKTGTGTWSLTGANGYTGGTTLSGGVLSVSSLANGGTASSIGKSTNAATNLVFDGGTLQYTGAAVSTDRLFTLTSLGGIIDASGTGALTLAATGSVAFSGSNTSPTLTLAGSSTAANTFDLVLGNNGTGLTSLTKSGAGTWVLAGANTLSGTVTMSAGTLTVNSGASLGSSAASLVVNGGTLNLNNTAQSVASLAGTGGTLSLGTGHTFTDVQSTPTSFAGVLTGAGNFVKSGTDTLTLSGTNNFTGTTTINAGALAISADTNLGTGALTLNGGALESTASFTLTSSRGIALGTSGGGFLTDAGTTLAYGGVITGPSTGMLKKTGTGTLSLSGANTYQGGTTINAGTIVANNAAALGTGTVTLNGGTLNVAATIANTVALGASGGTITGTGSFTSAVTIGANTTLSPGNTVGTLAFQSGLTLGPGGTYLIQLQNPNTAAGTGYDTLNITGALAFTSTSGSPFTFSLQSLNADGNAGNLAGFDSSLSYNWTIATATSITGFTSTLPSIFNLNTSGFTNATGTGVFTLGLNGPSNALVLNFSPVPEPSTWALLATGLGALVLVSRRRRAR